MDTTRSIETPRRPQSAVRRSLLGEFNEAGSPTCPTPSAEFDLYTPQTEVFATPVEEQARGWGNVFKVFMCMVSLCLLVIGCVYQYFPVELVMWLTRELIIISVITVLCAILFSVTCIRKFWSSRGQSQEELKQYKSSSAVKIPVKRTFSGDGTTIWSEFIRYFENVANLNQWPTQRMIAVLLTTLRGQAETYAYGLPENVLGDYQSLKDALNQRFGHTALKESYIAEAKLRCKKQNESFRDYGQAIEDLYRRAHPANREFVEINSLKTFLDNCSDNDDFRLAVKRARPKTVNEAVTVAMQEECIRIGEMENTKSSKFIKRDIYSVPFESTNRDQGESQGRQNRGNVSFNQRNTARRKCYSCGSESHLRNRCPRLVQTSSTSVKSGSARIPRSGNGPPPRQ